MISLSQFEPDELGLPPQFTSFRPCQIEAVEQCLESIELGVRFDGLGLPTGSGKSLVAAVLHKVTGMRTVVLTATKGLQAQYLHAFQSMGIVDVRGKANYECQEKDGLSCRFGQLEGCEQLACMEGGYEAARRRFQWGRFGVTNYQYWVRANVFGRGLEPAVDKDCLPPNPVEMLVCDESHSCLEELSRALQVALREDRLLGLGMRGYPKSDDLAEWAGWAGQAKRHVEGSLKIAVLEYRRSRTRAHRDRVYQLQELDEALEAVERMSDGDWVLEMQLGTEHGRRWQFDCVWPGKWAEARLFVGVPHVVMMSGTLRPQTMTMLGIGKDVRRFREWPRQFPAERSPVYQVPSVRLNHKVTEEGLLKWVEVIDDIIDSRLERKGIVHTVSYRRQQFLLDHSRHSSIMLANTKEPDSDSAVEVLEKFREASPPAVLVSPSFGTGWDFPGDDARWQVIGKVPFPEFKSKVMQARLEKSPRHTAYLTMQELVQACGRGMRSAEDWCETLVVDDSLTFFMVQNKDLAPGWFKVVRLARAPKVLRFGESCVTV